MPPPLRCSLWDTLSADEKAVLNAEAAKAGYTDTIKWLVDTWCTPGTDQVLKRYIIENEQHCVHMLSLAAPSTVLHVEKDLETGV